MNNIKLDFDFFSKYEKEVKNLPEEKKKIWIQERKKIPLTREEKNVMKIFLDKFLNKLEAREKEVIIQRFGIYDGRKKTHKEIAQILNLSGERIRQIEKIALEKMRFFKNNS